MVAPNHLAIIMDGNGRWAKAQGKPRTYGHKKGRDTLDGMYDMIYNHGIKYFTVYAFSTENWKRPESEVKALMTILKNYLKTSIKRANDRNIRVRVIGTNDNVSPDIQKNIKELVEATKNNTGLQYTIAFNYGGRDEIRRAVTSLAKDVEAGKLKPDDITEEMINSRLDTWELPDPDLILRTSGEQRLSNFLLWQAAYSEFYYTDCHWPDFNEEELEKAIEWYNRRDRRYGAVKEE